jgi:electron transfer flavoprotein alpha subunit
MTRDVVAFSEEMELAGEVSAAAALLAGSLGPGKTSSLVLLDDALHEKVSGSVLLVRSNRPAGGNYELTARALEDVVRREGVSLVLIGATRLGRQVAARLAVRTGRPVLSDVRDLHIDGERIVGVRGAFAGKILATVSATAPCIATVPPGAYASTPGSPSSVETLELSDLPAPKTRILETKPKPKADVDLKTASIIVSAGRGFRKKEDLVMAENLATALGGVLGASRPLSSDLGWVGEERHIGLTGVYVHPALYIAIGISGQLQHVAGIKDSRVIVAINKDAQAPIFQVADYGLVGDLYQVVPALLQAVASQKRTGTG